MLTEKENFLMTLRGECPEWIPTYSMLAKQIPGEAPPPCIMLSPPFLQQHRKVGVGGIDIWGVEYVASEEANGATMPKTRDFILDDITKWRDVIKAPDISDFDWEMIAKKDIENSLIDRSQTALSFDLHFGYFQNLMAFMGFTEGLCAIYEEPEETAALLNYLCDFYCEVSEKVIDYYKPDILSIKDDTASWTNTFIPLDIYNEVLLPVYDRQAKFGRDRGLPITFHNCGKCESFIEPMRSVGVTLWEPCQTCNDLKGIKAKYGNSLVMAGGWDARGRMLEEDVTDEEIIESLKSTLYTLADGGGYAFMGGFMGKPDDPVIIHKNKVVWDTFREVSKTIYKH